MIRKLLVVAAAVAIPASGIAAVSGAGIAGAAKPAPQTGSFAITGSVTFAAPGLTAGGSVTNKTSESSLSTITPSGFGGTSAIKSKIPTTTTACWATLPVYSRTAPVGGVLASGAPSSCDVGGTSAAGDTNISPATVKTALKDRYYYDTDGSFITGGTTSIVAALNAKPIKLVNNGNKSTLAVSGASAVLPGGVCGGDAGFAIDGTTTFVGASTVVINVCLDSDSGAGTTGNFVTDLLGGSATITSATIGGLSSVTYSA